MSSLSTALRYLLLAALLGLAPVLRAQPLNFGSAHVMVMDEATGEVLLQKDAATSAPIASITKLLTAMVVLDAGLDPAEEITVSTDDLDTLKHTRAGVPPGAVLTRATLLELALIASDNHAAAALARSFPGGSDGFRAAVASKIAALRLADTLIEEPTGLSPANRASAADLATVLRAASAYPVIAQITSSPTHATLVNGRTWAVKNTNGLVGTPGWNILLSKTGYTQEAGRCLVMRLQAAGRTLLVVLMGAMRPAERTADANKLLAWISRGSLPLLDEPPARPVRKSTRTRAHGRHAVASPAA